MKSHFLGNIWMTLNILVFSQIYMTSHESNFFFKGEIYYTMSYTFYINTILRQILSYMKRFKV